MSIMAIDYGGRRIGVAVSASGSIAAPHSVVKNEGEIVETLAGIAVCAPRDAEDDRLRVQFTRELNELRHDVSFVAQY